MTICHRLCLFTWFLEGWPSQVSLRIIPYLTSTTSFRNTVQVKHDLFWLVFLLFLKKEKKQDVEITKWFCTCIWLSVNIKFNRKENPLWKIRKPNITIRCFPHKEKPEGWRRHKTKGPLLEKEGRFWGGRENKIRNVLHTTF